MTSLRMASVLALLTLAGVALWAQGQLLIPEITVFKWTTYSVRMVPSNCADADPKRALCRRVDLREADEFRILDGTHVQYTYYNGRKLRAGLGAPSGPERMEVVVALYPLMPDFEQVTTTRTAEVRTIKWTTVDIVNGVVSREEILCGEWNSDSYDKCPRDMLALEGDRARLREPVWPKPERPRQPGLASQPALSPADSAAADKIIVFRTCEIINPDSVAAIWKKYRLWLAANPQMVARVEASEDFKAPQGGLARMRTLMSELGPQQMCARHLESLF